MELQVINVKKSSFIFYLLSFVFVKKFVQTNCRYMYPRQFNSANNFLSPSPDWSYKPTNPNFPISKSSPLSEDELGSMEYELWKEIGDNFMIKSTVNNWLVCSPDGGSLVNMVNGGISCNVTKVVVAGNCEDVTPNFNSNGRIFDSSENGEWDLL